MPRKSSGTTRGARRRPGDGGNAFPRTKASRFAAGTPYPPPPRSNARRSISSWKPIPARAPPSRGPASPNSAGAIDATIPLFPNPEFLARTLIPFTGDCRSPDAAFITSPPGHMQKE